jgi:hypothetical protein
MPYGQRLSLFSLYTTNTMGYAPLALSLCEAAPEPELFMRAKRVHGMHSITSYKRTPNNHHFRSEPA